MYGLLYQLKGCPRCMGDMVFDEGDWKCWQCGHYYYPRGVSLEDLALAEQQENLQDTCSADNSVPSTQPAYASEENGTPKKRRRGYGARPEKNIDSLIQAKKTSEERWWARNGHVVEYLDKGLSVREIAKLVGRGQRQIRTVRERLEDFRAVQEVADQ